MGILRLLIVALFIFWALVSHKDKSTHGRSMRLGILFAAGINLYFLYELHSSGASRFEEWHLPIAIYFPGLLALPGFAVVAVAKGTLKGAVPAHQWGIDEAKNLLVNDRDRRRRALARLYIALTPPTSFLAGWIMCGLLFARVVFHDH